MDFINVGDRRPRHPRPRRLAARLAASLLLALAGCDEGAGGQPDLGVPSTDLAAPQVPTVSAVLRANPENEVSALVDVTLLHAATVTVEWGDGPTYGQVTPALPAMNGTQTITIVGLTPAATTHARVVAASPAGTAATPDLTLSTGALPSSLPTWKVTTPNMAAGGYLMVSVVRVADFQGWAQIVDRAGRVLWYSRARGSVAPLVFDRMPNGHYAIYQNDQLGVEEIDLTGKVYHVWMVPSSVASLGTDGHEFVPLPNHNAAMIGIDEHIVDTRPYFDGGVADANELHNSLDEIDPDGGVAFHWSSFPEITPGELTPDILPFDPAAPDPSHGNAAALTPDGNFIYNVRNASLLVKLDRKTGAILWRMGGRRNEFTFIDDPENGVSHGHDFHFLPNGNLVCIDNGIEHTPHVTRAVEYKLDEKAKTATLVWSYRHAPDIFSPLAGSVRRLANGDTVVAWGLPGSVTQVDKDNKVVWEMEEVPPEFVPGGIHVPFLVYRAVPLASIY